jgi:PLP dependent protein
MSIAENLKKLQAEIPPPVRLIAVSKFKTAEQVMEAYKAGQKAFGELPKDIEWHLIGHLQTNKVKYMAPFVSLIHSVDSLKLLQEINKRAIQNNRSIRCLLQVHIAKEETKFGLSFDETDALLQSEELKKLQNVNIAGLMGMATNTDDENIIRSEFRSLRQFFEQRSKKNNLEILSMGMSSDYKIAIEEGSTMVRVGSLIFGER